MKTETNNSRIIIFAVVMVAIIAMMFIVIRGSSTSGKYDSFAQSLAKEGVAFYGAFWCPHCQQQEQWLDATRQKLAAEDLYKECSNPDQSQTQICIDKKIESYPTWTFPKGISVTSTVNPIVCSVTPTAGEDTRCTQLTSQYFKRWIFPTGEIVASDTEPTHAGSVWSFPPTSQLRGEISVQRLSEIAGVPLTTPVAAPVQ
jgi:hypothetical protein